MTALGFLYPGHSGEDDYPRIEQLLGSDIRVDLVHTDPGEGAHRVDTLRDMGSPARLAAGVEELRLSGAEAVVWASTSGGFTHGWDGAREQIRSLAATAGMPASSTSLGFTHAVRELGARRVAVGAAYPQDVAGLFAEFLRAAGLEVTGVHGAGLGTAAEAAAWGEAELLALVRAADRPGAEAVLLPGTALRTAAHLPALEKEAGKPVLTANQVTVWEGLRLADRRVNAPELGALFTREPLVQV
ncbi:aspartate/glutamate racemase family protein [Streptomyces griseoviridis]|jgi:maleate cis-trans isomerase|uniref:Maleate cis-trans isomerase n=3 Tax=Streptomyces TaxID=1883 RepID=A0ABT9LGX8_STRGD|nr:MULTISPECIES: aspartate/glutamate racemase family protein [Streptomyces]MDP9681997.1 maleate cis-trans isomerase [Streptomyces griseoviridis]GGS17012.1 decarboxylase [Streptomyces niveoruber]GGT03252.1 decarboxylase [Streptomyces griseoviridis]GGU35468.1 decarboxylase [Streptomyces daghestanicus]GHI34014.1 decarboxylase [Streptomyces daghestanicus]